jgi:deoxyhypusine synthase
MSDNSCGRRNAANYHDGKGLTPLKLIDLRKINNFSEMLQAMSLTGFGGGDTGQAANVLEAMVRDKDCFKVLTLAGAMTPAQMGLVVCDYIDFFGFNVVISTGALMLHGLIQGIGATHFKAPNGITDRELYYRGYDRIHTVLELEKNMDKVEEFLEDIFDKADPEKNWSSREVSRAVGEYLTENTVENQRSPFKSAFLKQIPVFIPAEVDSEIGLDIAVRRSRQRIKGETVFKYDPFLDLEEYADIIKRAVKNGKRLGIFTIGGGVPRNFAQQVAPYLDTLTTRLGEQYGAFARFHYAVRISTALMQDGGLSGCTYQEGVSWGKIVPPEEGGMTAEVFCDATIAWPWITKAVMERIGIE